MNTTYNNIIACFLACQIIMNLLVDSCNWWLICKKNSQFHPTSIVVRLRFELVKLYLSPGPWKSSRRWILRILGHHMCIQILKILYFLHKLRCILCILTRFWVLRAPKSGNLVTYMNDGTSLKCVRQIKWMVHFYSALI